MTRKKVTHASGIQYLPEPMYRIMGEFCSIENLLHTNSYFFFEVKRNIHYYRFNKTYSLIYHREYHFRDEVKERMKDVSKQLSLNLSGIYISSFVMAKSSTGNKKRYHPDNGWEEVCTIDVRMLKNVHSINFSNFYHRMDLGSRAFAGVHTLDLTRCSEISDVSMLGHIHTLILSGCEKISDVSALGNVHTLDLTCCRIRDVSMLGRNHTLILAGCSGIKDVSTLGGVHTLDLTGCDQIKDVSALGSVHTLVLFGCYRIEDVSALRNVHTLDLSYCSKVENNEKNVSALRRVHTLGLYCANGLRDADISKNVCNIYRTRDECERLRVTIPGRKNSASEKQIQPHRQRRQRRPQRQPREDQQRRQQGGQGEQGEQGEQNRRSNIDLEMLFAIYIFAVFLSIMNKISGWFRK